VICAEAKTDQWRGREPQIVQMRKDRARGGILDELETLRGEMRARIHHDEIVRCQHPADIVDADRQQSVGIFELRKRRAAAANENACPVMQIAERTKLARYIHALCYGPGGHVTATR